MKAPIIWQPLTPEQEAAGPRLVSACCHAQVYFAHDGVNTVIDFCGSCHKHCPVVAFRPPTPAPMTDDYLDSLNVKTHQRDLAPPTAWQRFYKRAFGALLLAILITALVKCS